jgi:hypothetical protein
LREIPHKNLMIAAICGKYLIEFRCLLHAAGNVSEDLDVCRMLRETSHKNLIIAARSRKSIRKFRCLQNAAGNITQKSDNTIAWFITGLFLLAILAAAEELGITMLNKTSELNQRSIFKKNNDAVGQ